MRAALLACLLLACGPGPSRQTSDGKSWASFRTRCGVEFIGMRDGSPVPAAWSQQAIQDVEDLAIREYATLFATACARLYGASLTLDPRERFQLDYGVTQVWVAGYTNCLTTGSITMVVANRKPYPSAYAHEMVHVIQRCNPVDHEHWIDLGIYAAIERVNDGP